MASWLWHIRHVIALDPEEQFELLEKKGGQPGPLLLLDCWRQRHTNLHRITAQLQGPAAGAMLATLRASNSDQVPAGAAVGDLPNSPAFHAMHNTQHTAHNTQHTAHDTQHSTA